MAQETTSLIMDLTGWKLLNNNIQGKCSFHICELGLKGECWRVTDWYVKRMQLKHNLSLIVIWDPSIMSISIIK